MSTTEKILEIMNSRQCGELITVGTKKCLGALSHPNIHFPPQQRPAGADGNAPRTPDESDEQVGGIVNTPETLNTAD